MQDYGLVSIITPSWNCGKFVEETIQSILAQTYTHWELLFQDDCSTDDTRELVMQYAARDARIKYACNPKNSGAAITRNNALQRATGRWIAFLDSDDLWLPEKLEKQLQFMVDNHYAFTYHDYTEIDEQGNDLGVYVSGKKHVNRLDMYACCWQGCLSVMYDTAIVPKVQIPYIQKANDTAMWMIIIRQEHCHLLKFPLAKYRRRKGSITPSGKLGRVKRNYVLFRVIENRNPLFASICMVWNIIGNVWKKMFYVRYYQ